MKNIISLLLVLLCAVPALHAATVNVSSLSALQTAINNAAPGDIIILANGVYTASSDITISKQGTAASPVTIQAQSIGGAEINGTAGFNIVSPARYIIIMGFKFTFNASQATMASGTSFCRWTRNIFQTPGVGENLLLNGNDHEVDYNTFQHKNALGRFIAVRGTGSQIAQRLHIHHNYFFDQQPQTGNGAETVQFGLSGYSLSSSNSIFEYNLFEECEGEIELLSVKSSAVTVRYNTIRNCLAQFTLRHGNQCLVYGNYFINTPGIRIFGDDHVIFSNHFENCNPAINIGNGDGEVADGDALTVHDRPDRVVIAFNTLVNNTSNYTQSGRTSGLGATNTTFANNIIQGGGAAASIAGPYTGGVWLNNIVYQANGAGSMPSGGYTVVNPLLARNATGTFHLQSGSPAIGAATGTYAAVTVDMDGQSRTSPLDIGADETATGPVIAQILSTSMVGHNGTDPSACLPVVASADDGNVPGNVLDNDLNTRWSASGDGQWIQFCLNAPATVSGVQIAFYQGNTRTSTFDIQTSDDGQNWANAALNVQSSGTTLSLETFSITPRTAKYVRIVGHGNSINAWNSYTEVNIQTGTGGGNNQLFTLLPTQDAYVRDGANATITHGTVDSTLLITKVNPTTTTGNNRESYLLFDASAVTGVINSVSLKVYGKLDLTTIATIPVGVFSVANTSWTENSLTWNNKPATSATELASATISSAAFNYATWDITNYVRSEINAGRKIIALSLKSLASNDSRVLFNSAEAGNNAPQLVIDATTTGEARIVSALINQSTTPVTTGVTLQSYPNPFKNNNNIVFNLDQPAHVYLSVYDLTGKVVAVLVNGSLAAGSHCTTFDAKQLPAGIYWVKLFYNGKNSMKQIVKE